MSLSSIAYREVDTIVSTWTTKYKYHISLIQSKSEMAKFMVQFSLTKPQKPIPIGTVRVYFTCKCQDQLSISFRFQKDSLIHSIDKTIRHKQIEKWIDDALEKKLLVRRTVFYLGTTYEETRVKDQRLDKLLEQKIVVEEPEYVWIDPELLSDQIRSIEIMQKPDHNREQLERDLKVYFQEIDTQCIGVVTRPQFIKIISNLGIKLNSDEEKQILKRVDKDNTGTVEFDNYQSIVSEILEAKKAKNDAQQLLLARKQEQIFASVLSLIGDEAQDIESELLQHFRALDEDETGITNISEIKTALQKINKKAKQHQKPQVLNAIEMAEITKILTDQFGYKSIPYTKIHQRIIELKIKTFSTGLMSSKMTKLEVYIREICDKYDEKKLGRIKLEHFIEAIQKSEQIKLTKAQIYLLENILPIDTKNEISYTDISKFLAELIKKFYIHSSKKKV